MKPGLKNRDAFLSDLRVGILFNQPMKPVRGEDLDYVAEAEVEDQVGIVQEALRKLGIVHHCFPLRDDIARLIRSLKSKNPDVVINLCESAFGDSQLEMDVPSILELLDIPYTGSPPLTLGLRQNKGLTKDILKANRIPTPDYQIIMGLKSPRKRMDYPLIVKPLSEDASLGISRKSLVRNDRELATRIRYVNRAYNQPALVEKYIDGRELNVAVLGNEEPRCLPISEILFEFLDKPKIVDYSAKWLKESDEYRKTVPVCPAKLDRSLARRVKGVALQAYRLLRCRDYARVDIRLRRRVPYVLEVNANPDISPESGFVRSLGAAGIPFDDFVREILLFALRRRRRADIDLRLLKALSAFDLERGAEDRTS